MPQREHQNIQGNSSPDPSSAIISFDELAKGLATGAVPRGKALRWMGSALLGAALASVPGMAWANDRCSEGQTRCGDRCVKLQTNERHCGSCRNRCGSNQTCCKGRCVNLQTNERHCGACFNRCPEGQECAGGVCQGGSCPDYTYCCLCGYLLPDGSEDYSHCAHGTTIFSQEDCRQYCIDTTPPGGELFSASFGYTTPETYPGQRYMCAGSTSTGFGCDLQAC
jgi:hypothetical protein